MTPTGERRCGNCMYWARWRHYGPNGGMCRRHPPKVFILGIAPTSGVLQKEQSATPIVQAYYPPITDDAWCGEWSMKTEGEA